jgi:hypothetical protein
MTKGYISTDVAIKTAYKAQEVGARSELSPRPVPVWRSVLARGPGRRFGSARLRAKGARLPARRIRSRGLHAP